MNPLGHILRRDFMFALVTGATDGVLTALTLAGHRMIDRHVPIERGLAIRVAIAASLSGAFAFFVATYAKSRQELIGAERHLNLHPDGNLAATRLGREILNEAIGGCLLAAVSSLGGALIPTLVGEIFPGRYSSLIIACLTLAILGACIAHIVMGRKTRWTIALVLAGLAFSFIGAMLHVV